MSHYYALAIVPADGDVKELLAETMAPYDENREVESYEEDGETYWRNPVGLWDWYSIGGRWTGNLSGYDPAADPANVETCWLCQGGGMRDDELGRAYRATTPEYTCNGCNGIGRKVKWPTQWERHPGDVLSALDFTSHMADLPAEKMPYAVFTHGSESVALKERWNSEAHDDYHPECARTDRARCEQEHHLGAWVKEHDDESMRAVLATILAARMRAGHADRVIVVDYHS